MGPNGYVSLHVSNMAQGMALLGPVARIMLGDLRAEAELRALAAHLGATPDVPPEQRPSDLRQALTITESSLLSLELLEGAGESPGGLLKGIQVEGVRALLRNVTRGLGWKLRQSVRDRIWGLYVIIDPQATSGRKPREVAEAAIRGGARLLQLRDKATAKGDVVPLARKLMSLCGQHGVLFIMNDHADLARALGADGLHVGQHDLSIEGARQVLRHRQIVGRSNALVEEALQSQEQGADYIAVGTIYGTSTKKATRPAGLETLSQVRTAVGLPVVAIGGINQENVGPVVEAGADAICVISAVGLAPDPEKAARGLVEKIRAAGGRA